MKITGNTILITGGGSGIGRGLAEALQAKGNQVVIAGRSTKALDATTDANPGMKSMQLDITDPSAIRSFADRVAADFPALNVLMNNAGIMRPENILEQPADAADAEAMITTNLLGPIRLTAALLPLLRRQADATIINNSSGLAFVPLAMTATYCATKAAIHSYTQSLRYQLRSTSIEVLELVPPYVQTELMGSQQLSDPNAMPLAEFVGEVMALLEKAGSPEINVERVKPLRFAADQGAASYDQVFNGMNGAFAAH